ncbi:MAG: ABC transporter permease [Burkholderiales bacterium]|nr:ABC transporter permease [Burkholderiales bacterium]
MVQAEIAAREVSLAARNVLRHKRRSGVAVAAVAFGVIALILANSFVAWILWAMRETTIRSHLGHVQVSKAGYRENGTADPFAYLLAPDLPESAAIASLPHVQVIAPRLRFSGLVSRGDATVSFAGEGVDPAKEAEIQRSERLPRAAVNIVAGADLAPDEPATVILGEGLALNLGAKVGDAVVLLANTPSGGINAVEVRVKGLFSTISKAFDDTALRLPLATARTLLRVQGEHQLVLLLDRTERTREALGEAERRLSGRGLEFTPWFELSDFYNKTVELFGKQAAVVKLIIAVIIVLSISSTLMMSVMERTGEIGTAMALGVTRARILVQFLSEGVLLGVLGGVIGVVLGVVGAWAISAIGIPMPPPPGQSWGYTGELRLTAGILADAFMLAVLTTLVASLYPAWKASRMVIVDALRFNK